MKIFIFLALAVISSTTAAQLKFICSTAMLCVDYNLCDRFGVISKTPVTLTENEELFRHPLVPCAKESGGDGVCCRDPEFKDDWPADWVDPGRMSYEDYMASLRIKKMIYTTPKPEPTKPQKPSDAVKFDEFERTTPKVVLPTTQKTLKEIEVKVVTPKSEPSTSKLLVIGMGRVEETQETVTSPPRITEKVTAKVIVETQKPKVDRSFTVTQPPVNVVESSKVEIETPISKPTKSNKKWPEKPIVVVSADKIEIIGKPKLDIVINENSRPVEKKIATYTKDLTPKKRTKVTTAAPIITSPIPVQTGLHPLLLTGCPRRNRVSYFLF